ncbi:unnamed protein product [Peniophora sp. CBMAI 1063]|nr:unnamed protein product [Peniophora sp. CBMAI 1063]
MSSDSSTLLGVVLMVRHGDRAGLYQDPLTYAASHTTITPLGAAQELALGALLRQRYLNSSSPNHIASMNTGLVNDTQVVVRTDSGDEGGVIYASANALLQGLFPPTDSANTTLSNGTTVTAPLGGYQYVPIDAVNSAIDVELEGFTSCNTYTTHVSEFYNSTFFSQKQNESTAFLESLPPYLDGRPVTLENMWNIFDFMNVNSIHNATFNNSLPATYLSQARDLANWHEYYTFSDSSLDGIGNIAMRTMLPSVITQLQAVANASNPTSFVVEAISYKPFLSLFNQTGIAEQNTSLAGIVNYAAAVALEVRAPADGGEPMLRFLFKNGTDDADFNQYGLLGSSGDVELSKFVNTLYPTAVNTTAEWCTTCGNTVSRGCGALQLATQQGREQAAVHQPISPVGAGFLGAGLTIFVFIVTLGVLAFLGLLTFGRRPRAYKSEKA